MTRKGELIQLYIPLNNKSPIYMEIICRIESSYKPNDNLELLKLNDENKSILLFNVPSNIKKDYLNEVFSIFGDIKEMKFNNSDEMRDIKDNLLESDKLMNSWIYITYYNDQSINKIREKLIKCENSLIKKLYINNSEINTNNSLNYRNKLLDIIGKRVNAKILQKEVDIYMTKYDIEKQIEEENMKLESEIPDEDGFIKIIGKKQKAPDGTVVHSFEPEKEIQDFRIKKQINKKEKKSKLYNDFYRFQIRENKKKEIEKLDNSYLYKK